MSPSEEKQFQLHRVTIEMPSQQTYTSSILLHRYRGSRGIAISQIQARLPSPEVALTYDKHFLSRGHHSLSIPVQNLLHSLLTHG